MKSGPVKAFIRDRRTQRVFYIWQDTTIREMQHQLYVLGYWVLSIEECESHPRGYTYVYDLEDWDY